MDRATLIAAMQAAAANAAKPRPVEVPGWGTIFVRDVTVAEASENIAEQDEAEGDAKKLTLARSACRVICDEDGGRVLDPATKADVELLAAQPWSILRRVLAASDSVGEGKA